MHAQDKGTAILDRCAEKPTNAEPAQLLPRFQKTVEQASDRAQEAKDGAPEVF